MGRKKVKPPQIDYLKEYAVPRFVTEESICEKYDLSGVQCRKMARAANAFFEIRKAQLIDRTIFEKTVNDEELKRLESYAKEAGYPDISSYCKDEVLRLRTYAELWERVKEKIATKEKDDVFTLGQLVDNPPANLGVKLYKNQVE
ncbi:MAG: hypothetical protein II020_04495, partial [Lachnospiraceae bacterium]|nr:hypothetical protein [Lachnospiraceae bacterium]